MLGNGQPKAAGTWDYYGSLDPSHHKNWSSMTTFSIGVFKWLAKGSRPGTKKGGSIKRFTGPVAAPGEVYAKALAFIAARAQEESRVATPTNEEAPDVHLYFEGGDPHYRLEFKGKDVTASYPSPVLGSPSGVSWGYSGSGPHRLAALVLSLHFPLPSIKTEEEVWESLGYSQGEDGEDFNRLSADERNRVRAEVEQHLMKLPVRTSSGEYLAWPAFALLAQFKLEKISSLAANQPAVITAQEVREWLAERALPERE